MNILYISSMFDEIVLKKFYKKDKSPNFAANKYHQLLCRGLAEHCEVVNAYSTLPVSNSNSNKIIISTKKHIDSNLIKEYISLINIPGVKHFILFLKTFFKTLFFKKNTVLIYDALTMPSAYGAVIASKVRCFKSIAIVTDLPDFIHSDKKKLKLLINNSLLKLADSYIFLTKQMNDVVNLKNKPYIVLEGHVDESMKKVTHTNFDGSKKVVLYAGGLQKKYGIADLIKSFIEISKDNEEIHIYGDGDYANEIIEISKNNFNVKYFGCCSNQDVIKAELEATLLVNPRTGKQEFTKYSFPSKTLEYMASGTPVLCAKLPGIPDEYDDYLYYFDDSDKDGLKKSLRNILDLKMSDLELKGRNSKEFVLKHKSCIHQAKKIIDFINDELK